MVSDSLHRRPIRHHWNFFPPIERTREIRLQFQGRRGAAVDGFSQLNSRFRPLRFLQSFATSELNRPEQCRPFRVALPSLS